MNFFLHLREIYSLLFEFLSHQALLMQALIFPLKSYIEASKNLVSTFCCFSKSCPNLVLFFKDIVLTLCRPIHIAIVFFYLE
jgi:hypothetical protein